MSRAHDAKEDDIAEWEDIIKRYKLLNKPGEEYDSKKTRLEERREPHILQRRDGWKQKENQRKQPE